MSRARTLFSLRLRNDLLVDLRIIATNTPATMTSAIEDALDAHLPPLLNKMLSRDTLKLERSVRAAREQ